MRREEEILQKYKKLPDDVRMAVHKRLQDINSDVVEITKDAEPFLIQLAIEDLSNQRNLAIIAGSLATVSILMLERLSDTLYLWMFGLSIIGLLLTTLFAVIGSAVDVKRGNKNLKYNEATGIFHRQKEVIYKLILGGITPLEADKQEEDIKDDMLRWTFRSPRQSRGVVWQTISHTFFVVTMALMTLFFILQFVSPDHLGELLNSLLNATSKVL